MDNVLEIDDLKVRFGASEPVKGISLSLAPGQRVGLVGESGSGKSLTALSVMRLAHGSTTEGRILLNGRDVLRLPPRAVNRIRGGEVAMVYQDPMSSLNPVHTVGRQITESLRLHKGMSRREADRRAVELLADVGVSRPEIRIGQYPHEFSGGMRQRVMIAIAMSGDPQVLICDEPTTALDVTTQARILDLLDHLAAERGTAVLLITHDLGVAAGLCDDIVVMRHGRVVESATADQLYHHPNDAYTRALLGAVVGLDADVNAPIPTLATLHERPSAPAKAVADLPTARAETLVRVSDLHKQFKLGPREHVTAIDRP